MRRVIRLHMNRSMALLLPLAAVAVTHDDLDGQLAFEGRVLYQNLSSAPAASEVTYFIKAGRFRQEIPVRDGVSVMIVNEATREVITQEPGGRPLRGRLTPRSTAPVVVDSIGEVDTVAGHSCREVWVRHEDFRFEACVAEDLGFSSGGVLPPAIDMAEIRRTFPDGFFPLRFVFQLQEDVLTIEAVELERMAVPDSLLGAGRM